MSSTPSNDRIRLALPNKGRLADRAVALLDQAGLKAAFRGDRALVADLGPDFQALFVRASDIPEFLADGAAEVGITGADLVAESGRDVTDVLDLGFGQCRVAVAVREDSPVGSASELPAGTRVATSFPRIARTFFDGLGIPIEIAPITGATEIAPHLGVADVIVDLVSTGSTLRMNNLRETDTIMTSTARLVASSEALSDPAVEKAVDGLSTALESVLRAQRKRYLMANVPRDRLEEVRRVIPGINGPTIVEVLDGDGWVAAHAVVEADEVYQSIADLKKLGAEGILVTRIERLMP
jgi:ATP phosphoribosyltransferase